MSTAEATRIESEPRWLIRNGQDKTMELLEPQMVAIVNDFLRHHKLGYIKTAYGGGAEDTERPWEGKRYFHENTNFKEDINVQG
jgi:hypothetical protein